MKIINWIKSHQLVMFLFGACVLTVASTVAGLVIYKVSGAYKFDLSRPGYEDVREDIKDDDDNTMPFPTNGVLDPDAIQDFRDRYHRITDRLNKMNDYDAEVLSDENLGLVSEESSAENPEESVENAEQ